MDNLKLVNEVISDLEKRNWENVENKLTDNFKYSGAVPQPIDKKQWMNVQRSLQKGLPDLRLNLKQVELKGPNRVTGRLKLTGTHTGEMPAITFIPGAKSIAATGKKVTLPEELVEFTFEGDKISGLYVEPVAHGGVRGVIEQIQSNN